MNDRSQSMRAHLASAGIFLDEPKQSPKPATTPRAPVAIDRDEIRRVLAAAGAPARDLDWMVSSCPSVAHALAYRPTIKEPSP